MRYSIGIDFGGTNIAVGLVDESYRVVTKSSLPTGKGTRSVDAMVADMAVLCRKVAEDGGITLPEVSSIGIATPGTVNSEKGIVIDYPGMGLSSYPMAAILSDCLDGFDPARIRIANDANAAALGEAVAGAAKGADTALMITLGTGVGGGIILGGRIYDGFNFSAAELGHTVIVKDGHPCACGRRGCFEQYASATALIRMTREEMETCPESAMWQYSPTLESVNGLTSFECAKAGDAAAKRVVDRYIGYLACGVANMMNIFQPQVLCIGGGVCGQGDNLLKPLSELVFAEQYAKTAPQKTRLVIATLGNDAGIVGAAAL
ncbi:MAG: ROK family protein [Ruminococcaceae bacterium]|nr:ROK family protein [Oscillospiraceae bacterium]